MNCPVCDEKLREVEKHGVSVDICPGCKGVWLDRGELEKVLEMAAAGGPGAGSRSDQARSQHVSDEPRRPSRGHDDHDDHDKRDRGHDYDEHSQQQGYGQRKKKSSWLGDIFEGFGGD